MLWGKPSGQEDLGLWLGALGLCAFALTLAPKERTRALCGTAFFVGTGASIWAIYEKLTGAQGLYIHGGQGNANWLGLLLAQTLPICLAYALSKLGQDRKKALLAWIIPGLVQLYALYLSHSRVAWIAAAVVLPAMVLGKAFQGKRLWVSLGAYGLAALLAGGFAFRGPVKEQAQEIESQDVPVELAWQGRLRIWQASWDASLEALPWGLGLGGFGHGYLQAQGKRLQMLEVSQAARRFQNATTAHNDWLQVLAETGPMGLLLLLAAMGAGLKASWQERTQGGLGSMAAFCLCALGDSPLRLPAPVLLLTLVLATGPEKPVPKAAYRLLVIAALGASSLVLAGATARWQAMRWKTQAELLEPEPRLRVLEKASRLSPDSGEIALTLGLAQLELGQAEDAIASLQRSDRLLANVGTSVALGNAWLLLGEPPKAVREYERALGLHPGSFRAHANLTEALLRLGDKDKAEQHFRLAQRIYPGHPRLQDLARELEQSRSE